MGKVLFSFFFAAKMKERIKLMDAEITVRWTEKQKRGQRSWASDMIDYVFAVLGFLFY